MYIKLDIDVFNKMMKALKDNRWAQKKSTGYYPAMEYIEITVTNGSHIASATASDGYKVVNLNIPIISVDEENPFATDGKTTMLIPYVKPFTKDIKGYVDIYEKWKGNHKYVYIHTHKSEQRYEVPTTDFIEWQRHFDRAKDDSKTIHVNPQFLIDVLTALKDEDNVALEFNGKLEPIIIRGSKTQSKALVLPIRINTNTTEQGENNS